MLFFSNLSFQYNKNILLSYQDHTFLPGCTIISAPSGQGKSTLFKLIAKLIYPTTGTIFWNNTNIQTIDNDFYYKNCMSIVMQSAELSEYFNLNIYLKILSLQENLKLINYEYYLEYLDLNKLLLQNISDCSGGEKYKIAFFLALCKNTPLLLLDEPTAHLDEKNSQLIIDIIKKRDNNINIIISHDKVLVNDNLLFKYFL